jgi:hypothetical protein
MYFSLFGLVQNSKLFTMVKSVWLHDRCSLLKIGNYYLRLIFVAICMLRFSGFSVAQTWEPTSGAANMAVGNPIATTTGLWAASTNPAGMSSVNGFASGMYFENRFAIKELATQTAVFVFGNTLGGFGLVLGNYGNPNYHEYLMQLGFGRWIVPERFSLGMKVGSFTVGFGDEYGKKTFFAAEFGAQCYPLKKLMVGLHISNLVSQQLSDEPDSKIPSRVSFGVQYEFNKFLCGSLTADKVVSESFTNFKMGIAYDLRKSVAIRCGIASRPFSQSVGIGFFTKKWHYDVAFSRVDPLGYTPQISVSYGPK